jgi:hypothetical protein
MGIAVVESGNAKNELRNRLLNAQSVKDAIELLRDELLRHKKLLMQ